MKKSNSHGFVSKALMGGVFVGLACTFPVQSAQADDTEFRAGAVIQVPFALGSSFPSFDPTKIRLGLTTQLASVEDDTITRFVDNTLTTTRVDEGDQVFGLEGNVFVEVFNGFNGSVELLGFYGGNDIQGAAGAGYSFADGFFLDVKAMFPYSEIGVRFMNQAEIYGGVKTLGDFDPDRKLRIIDVSTPDV
jgi:hypothetical protein